jgi:hydrogenase nickel incorporation protein HypB
MHQTFDAALEMNLLHANQDGADRNRAHFEEWGIVCVNLMSSPGAGKTQLLERTLQALNPECKMAVIEGDMTTELDAERLRQYGVPIIAINTGRACHLDSKMVAGGIHSLTQNMTPPLWIWSGLKMWGTWFVRLNLKWANMPRLRCSV